MKTFVLFLAMIFSIPFMRAQACQADFTYQNLNGVVYFTNTSTPVDSFTTYTWSFGDGGTSDLFGPHHAYSTAGLYAVCLTMSNGFLNCSSTFCDTILVDSTNYSGNCAASFTFSMSGLDVAFQNQSTWDSGQATFVWDFGDGTTSSDFEPSHHYNQGGNYYTCLTISTTDSCTHHFCSNVAVYDSNCLVTFSYQITGNSVTFLPSNANYGIGSYYWSFGDNSSSSEIAPTHHYNYPGHYSICLWYSDSSCSSLFCDSIYISGSDSCYAEFYVNEYNGIVNFYPSFIDYSKMYSWDFGDGTSSNDVTPNHDYVSDGAYVVCLTVSSFLCSATHCDSVYYTNDTTNNNGGNCLANFEVSGIDTATSTIWLTDLSQGGIHYFWDFGDSTFSVEQYPSHTYAQNGTYYVCLTITCDSNLTSEYCAWVGLQDSLQGGDNEVRNGFTLNVKPSDVSGVFSPSANESLNVYPNPASESVKIVLPETIKGNAIVLITNDLGQTVNQKSIFIYGGMNTSEIDIHSLASGLYLVRVIASGKSYSANVLKQ